MAPSTITSSWQQDVRDDSFGGHHQNALGRRLSDHGSHGEEVPLDYSVLSVGVTTLGLILFVEVLRHRLENYAAHRPFFKAVLEVTCTELATLGLVELCVFLLMRYYGMEHSEREEIFAEVHFALFYTAIFNAFQSVLCAFATRQASARLWVRTEHLELDHYVEIREEFDRVSHEYHLQRGTWNENGKSYPSSVFQDWTANVWASIRNPGLKHRYFELLVQVRFHQLRIQFLENNQLPLTLKVSDYLKSSEESVLTSMVHVSGTAWLMLTGGFNLVYFVMGIVANRTGDAQIVGTAMMAIFFSVLILFIVICVSLYVKMSTIFETVLEMKHSSESNHEVGAEQQRNLFWFHEPQLVISIIQSMQFGYAIALSIVIMFWEDLGVVQPLYYLLTTLACYTIFVYVLAKVLPQFTLCTSLGHLVNKDRLNETLGMYRIKEAQRHQKRFRVERKSGGDLEDWIIDMTAEDEFQEIVPVAAKTDPKINDSSMPPFGGSAAAQSSMSQLLSLGLRTKNSEQGELSLTQVSSTQFVGAGMNDDSTLLAEFVKMDTSQLRQQLSERSQTRIAERPFNLLGSVNIERKHQTPDVDREDINFLLKERGAQTKVFTLPQDEAQNLVDEVLKTYADDDSTADTERSFGDLSEVAGSPSLQMQGQHTTAKNDLHDFFVSTHYPLTSHVFGTSVIFFLIGMRLEIFNSVTGIFDQSTNTWEMSLHQAFWLQAIWYLLFMLVSLLAVWAVSSSGECMSVDEKRVFTAAVMDLFLSTLCLALLLAAEVQRCCHDENSFENDYGRRVFRLLSHSQADSYASSEEIANGYDDVYFQCCPPLGYRTFGGYGLIEPCTALIGLRVLRFWAAKYVVNLITGGAKKTRVFSHSGTKKEHSSSKHDSGRGTVVELWQRALKTYPHIVTEYGQFSGELLQAMLGLEIHQDDKHVLYLPSIGAESFNERTNDEKQEKSKNPVDPYDELVYGDQHSSLVAEIQGIILAGMLGKPVKPTVPSSSKQSFAGEPLQEQSMGYKGDQVPTSKLEFEIDNNLLVEEQDALSTFIAPDARLVRSMRRCDRRFYPLLKEWVTVDVVVTDFEIVYFQVEDTKKQENHPTEATRKRRGDALRRALQATKGGKGLRLIDVAYGRKVVGRLDLADVTQVHVERNVPLVDNASPRYTEPSDGQIVEVQKQLPSEFWQKPSHVEVHTQCRVTRWATLKEDRLRLDSAHGTLLLRYFSDLNQVSSSLKKGIAFQWAKTVAHICGTDQLKQPLPNFGANNDDELRDYLEVIPLHHRTRDIVGSPRQIARRYFADRARTYSSRINASQRSVAGGASKQSKSFDDEEKTGFFQLLQHKRSYSFDPDARRGRAQEGGTSKAKTAGKLTTNYKLFDSSGLEDQRSSCLTEP